MSAMPQRTRVLIKDLLFQEKYKLTNTQIDIMSYIFNSQTWAIKVDGFLIITTKKLISDMPQITQKTLESALRALKSMELIETELISVPQWKGENLEIGDRKYTLYKVEDVKGGKVKITLKDKKGKIATISNKTGGRNKPLTYTPNMCEKIILSLIR